MDPLQSRSTQKYIPFNCVSLPRIVSYSRYSVTPYGQVKRAQPCKEPSLQVPSWMVPSGSFKVPYPVILSKSHWPSYTASDENVICPWPCLVWEQKQFTILLTSINDFPWCIPVIYVHIGVEKGGRNSETWRRDQFCSDFVNELWPDKSGRANVRSMRNNMHVTFNLRQPTIERISSRDDADLTSCCVSIHQCKIHVPQQNSSVLIG